MKCNTSGINDSTHSVHVLHVDTLHTPRRQGRPRKKQHTGGMQAVFPRMSQDSPQFSGRLQLDPFP